MTYLCQGPFMQELSRFFNTRVVQVASPSLNLEASVQRHNGRTQWGPWRSRRCGSRWWTRGLVWYEYEKTINVKKLTLALVYNINVLWSTYLIVFQTFKSLISKTLKKECRGLFLLGKRSNKRSNVLIDRYNGLVVWLVNQTMDNENLRLFFFLICVPF